MAVQPILYIIKEVISTKAKKSTETKGRVKTQNILRSGGKIGIS